MFHLRKILLGGTFNSLRNVSRTYSVLASASVPIEIGYIQETLSTNINLSIHEEFRHYSYFTNTIIPKIVEVGPRDGLQNITKFIPTEKKKILIDKLVNVGLKDIEVTSFVSKKAVPQMADAEEIIEHCNSINKKYPDRNFIALTPNSVGYNKAIECGVNNVAIFTAASETFCKKNIGCSIDESLDRYNHIRINSLLKGTNVKIRGYVSCIAGCPYEDDIDIDEVVRVSRKLFSMGCYEISLGDTIGVGNPEQISSILDAVLKYIPAKNIAVHFHDTMGNALENIKVAIEKNIMTIDSSIGGFGGCPFAPGAPGNVATEDVVELLHKNGLYTGLCLNRLKEAADFAKSLVQ